jgi:hypothetical protein
MEKTGIRILMEQASVSLYFTVLGYCLGRQLIALYYAVLALKKARRNLENSYMNMVPNMDDMV